MKLFSSRDLGGINPPNHALLEAREMLLGLEPKDLPEVIRTAWALSEWDLTEHQLGWRRFTQETVDQMVHAHKVLGRLYRILVT